jgi:hypothetical protein
MLNNRSAYLESYEMIENSANELIRSSVILNDKVEILTDDMDQIAKIVCNKANILMQGLIMFS